MIRSRFPRSPLPAALLVAATLPLAAACGGRGDSNASATATASARAGGASPTVTATVSTSIVRVVTADGALAQPLDPQRLTFTSAGTVSEVLVAAGDHVDAGQP